MLRYLRTLFFSLGIVLISASAAWAADGAHESPFTLGMRALTAAAVAYIIYRFAGKAIVSAVLGRREGIRNELDSLEARKEKAREDLMAVEARIANLNRERESILAEYEARGEALKAEITAKAEKDAARIVTQAKQAARNEIDSALAAMRAELAEQIVAAAAKSIAGALTDKDQEKLLNNSLTKVVLQ